MAEGVLKIRIAGVYKEVPNLLAPNAVTAGAVITDHAAVRGGGGVRDVQGSTVDIADNGVVSIPAIGDGGLASYDLNVGNTGAPDYGMIRFGDGVIGRTSYHVAACDLDGAVVIRQLSAPATSKIEFAILESGGQAIRFALAGSAIGNGTLNPRSMFVAGPAVLNDEIVTVGYWQGQGIFDNLVCDTDGVGADLGVQNDLEVEGIIYVDNLLESTTDAGITAEGVLLKDGLVDGVDIGVNAVTAAATLTENFIIAGDAAAKGIKASGIVTVAGSMFMGVGNLQCNQIGINDDDDSHQLYLTNINTQSADLTLLIDTGDANRTLTLSGDPTLGDWFDQAVKAGSSPTFTAVSTDTITEKTADVGVTVDGMLIKDGSTAGLTPIGGVIAWFKSITGVPALPAAFVECNGQTLSDGDSPLNGQVMPNLNGGNRFLRGNSTSGGTGGSSTHALTTSELAGHGHGILDPGHSHAPITKATSFVTDGATVTAGTGISTAYTGTDSTTKSAVTNVTILNAGGGSAHENKPPYTNCVMIIRVK